MARKKQDQEIPEAIMVQAGGEAPLLPTMNLPVGLDQAEGMTGRKLRDQVIEAEDLAAQEAAEDDPLLKECWVKLGRIEVEEKRLDERSKQLALATAKITHKLRFLYEQREALRRFIGAAKLAKQDSTPEGDFTEAELQAHWAANEEEDAMRKGNS